MPAPAHTRFPRQPSISASLSNIPSFPARSSKTKAILLASVVRWWRRARTRSRCQTGSHLSSSPHPEHVSPWQPSGEACVRSGHSSAARRRARAPLHASRQGYRGRMIRRTQLGRDLLPLLWQPATFCLDWDPTCRSASANAGSSRRGRLLRYSQLQQPPNLAVGVRCKRRGDFVCMMEILSICWIARICSSLWDVPTVM